MSQWRQERTKKRAAKLLANLEESMRRCRQATGYDPADYDGSTDAEES